MTDRKPKITTVEIEFPHPPFELDNLVALSYDTKKLSNYLDFLNENDIKFNDDIDTLRFKVGYIETIKGQVKDLYSQQDFLQGKLFEALKLTNQNNIKIVEMGNQLRNHEDRIHNQENENKSLKKKLTDTEAHLKTLQNLEAEDRESIDIINSNLSKVDKTLEDHEGRIKISEKTSEEHDKRIKDNSSKIEIMETHIDKIYEESKKIKNLEESVYVLREVTEKRIDDMKRLFNDHVSTTFTKFTEVSNLIEKVFTRINELGDNVMKISITQSGMIGGGIGGNNNSGGGQTISHGDLDRPGKGMSPEMLEQFEGLKKDVSLFKKKNIEFDKANIELDEKIKKLRGVLIDLQANQQTKEEMKKASDERVAEKLEREKTNTFLHKTILEIKEISKHVENTLTLKINKDELENSTKQLNLEIEKLNQRLLDNMKLTDSKLQMFMRSGIGKAVMGELFHSDNAHLKEDFTQEINKIILFSMKNNQNLKTYFKNSEIHADALSTLNSKVNELLQEKEDERIENQRLFDEATRRIYELENTSEIQKKAYDDLLKKVDGEEIHEPINPNLNQNENNIQSQATSMKDMVKGVIQTLKFSNEKIDKLSQRQDTFGAETLMKLKKDLVYDSNKVFDEFRRDLKYSLERIHDQLREKVDKFNLEDLGKKIDSKISDEVGKKIDKTDLQKNTNLITKKINNLEGKLNKTLVETLIDLQVDDMPLITRKTNAGEKCASCNQVMNQNKGSTNTGADSSHANHYHGIDQTRKGKYELNKNKTINEVPEENIDKVKNKENKEYKEIKDSKDNKENKENKDIKDNNKENKDNQGEVILPDINEPKKNTNHYNKIIFNNKTSSNNINPSASIKIINFNNNAKETEIILNRSEDNIKSHSVEKNKGGKLKISSDNISFDHNNDNSSNRENIDIKDNKDMNTIDKEGAAIIDPININSNKNIATNASMEIKSKQNKSTIGKNTSSKNNKGVNTKEKSNFSNLDIKSITKKTENKSTIGNDEEKYNNAISGELGKTVVNPDNLLRAANKLFDGLEKKFNK